MASLPELRAAWEDTSFQLERLQANELCVKQEEEGLAKRTQPYFKLSFDPSETPSICQLGEETIIEDIVCSKSRAEPHFYSVLSAGGPPRVAVIREEGSNGDREMSVSLYMAGFEVG